ncbi:hypothetical protein [Nocardia australiensis]|uniref:hypothetical protein n=1 Tax=Nocardia australiensis TaxID=2887191 RepID=UPI001D1495AE|nr:hypothetical protein [Nocardia australiensis]
MRCISAPTAPAYCSNRAPDTVDRIATDTGFGTAVSLRHHFHRILGTCPAAHRAQFQTADASIQRTRPTHDASADRHVDAG